MQWKDIESALPNGLTLLGAALSATGVGAPVGAAVAGIGALVGHALGVDGTSPDAVLQAVQTDPAAAEKLLEVQSNTKIQLQQIIAQQAVALAQEDTKRGQQQIDDRVSARNMAVQTRDIWTPRIIAALVILGAFLGEGFALSHVIPAGSEVLAGRVLGTLDSALLAVLYYYFGGSAGSDRKTELLAGGQPAKDGA
ncbi:hypothetical protein [Nevskia soli]|uniref:hypothetical protein n=1 Tax=Nevskia soli TaxID=418856 RepID=UPI0012F7FF4C|nr:hypothetical protein [Nevskia soli]